MTQAVHAPAAPTPAAPPAPSRVDAVNVSTDWTKRLAVALGLTLLGVLACFDAWSDILLIAWQDEEASHLWLVPLVAGWLVASRKEVLPTIPLRSSWIGPTLVALGGGLNWYGYFHFTQAAWHLGALLIAIGCFLSVMGWRFAWRLLPVFAVLLFLVPVPGIIRQQIALPLQYVSASITTYIYEAMGFEILQTGNQLHFNGQLIGIAEACNGMRMVFALLLVTYAVVFASPLLNSVRALLLVLSPVLAIVCNVIRLVPTVYIYGESAKAGKVFHDLSGWGMVAVAWLLVSGVLMLLKWLYIPVEQTAGNAGNAETAGNARQSMANAALPVAAAVVCLALVGASQINRPRPADADPYHARVLSAMLAAPLNVGDWRGKDDPLPEAAVQLLKPNSTLSRVYTDLGGGPGFSFVIVQTKDARDMIGHYPPACYPNAGWVMQKDEERRSWKAGDTEIPGVVYTFERHLPGGIQRQVVANFLLLPDGRFANSMGDVTHMSSDYTQRFFGAAQVQVVMDASIAPERRDAIVSGMLTAHRPVFDAIRSGGASN